MLNYNALKDFLNSFPEYNGEYFISGESYGAVYVTLLAKKILDGINSKDIKVNLKVRPSCIFEIINFKGISIGNGALSASQQANSIIFQKYAYGLIGKTLVIHGSSSSNFSEYDSFASSCCNNTDPTQCDFFGMYLTVDNHGHYSVKKGVDPICGNKV